MTPEERAEQLFRDIDRIAQDYDHYEYGLPLDPETSDRICGVIAAALRAHGDERAAAERERAAKIAKDHPGCLCSYDENRLCEAGDDIARAISEWPHADYES